MAPRPLHLALAAALLAALAPARLPAEARPAAARSPSSPLPAAPPEKVGLSSERLSRIGKVLSADVEQGNPDFLLFVIEDGIAGGQRLQDHVADLEARPLYAFIDVLSRADEARNDVDVRLHAHA